jgi:hypothetical protein
MTMAAKARLMQIFAKINAPRGSANFSIAEEGSTRSRPERQRSISEGFRSNAANAVCSSMRTALRQEHGEAFIEPLIQRGGGEAQALKHRDRVGLEALNRRAAGRESKL